MANMIDYINENKDISFDSLPFTSVDNLVMSCLSYLDFSVCNYRIGLTLEEYYKDTPIDQIKDLENIYLSKNVALKLLKHLANSKRFKDIKIFSYDERFSSDEIYQFSATTFCLPTGELFVSFRGTDDKIASWHEDFALSYTCPVPSQNFATDYLDKILKSFDKKVYVGGHSKGGNLAVYSSMMTKSELQDKIIRVYSNDGPGLPVDAINSQKFAKIDDKIISIIPRSSIVGMLLYHSDKYFVVESSELAILQHNPMTWEISENDFIYTSLSKESIAVDKSVKNWLNSLTADEKKTFVDTVFKLFYSSNEISFIDMEKNLLKKIPEIIESFKNTDEKNKKMTYDIAKRLLKEIAGNFKDIKDAKN